MYACLWGVSTCLDSGMETGNKQANYKDLVWQNLELVAGLLEEVEVLGLGHDRLAKVNRAVDH